MTYIHIPCISILYIVLLVVANKLCNRTIGMYSLHLPASNLTRLRTDSCPVLRCFTSKASPKLPRPTVRTSRRQIWESKVCSHNLKNINHLRVACSSNSCIWILTIPWCILVILGKTEARQRLHFGRAREPWYSQRATRRCSRQPHQRNSKPKGTNNSYLLCSTSLFHHLLEIFRDLSSIIFPCLKLPHLYGDIQKFWQIMADSDPSGRTPRCRGHSLGAYARGSRLPGTSTNHESRVLSSRLVKEGFEGQSSNPPKKRRLKIASWIIWDPFKMGGWSQPYKDFDFGKAESVWVRMFGNQLKLAISPKHGPASSQGFARRSRCFRHFAVSSVSVDCHSSMYCYLWIHVDIQLLCQFKVLTQFPWWFMFSEQFHLPEGLQKVGQVGFHHSNINVLS